MNKSSRTPYYILAISILAQIALTYSFALTLRYELKTSANDGVQFSQIMLNFIAGNDLVSTIAPPYTEQSYLGIHFSPIIYAIVPVFYLFPYIETLLFLHSLFIALAAIPIFFIARKLLTSSYHALVISTFYLINPFVVNAQIWDFREIAFAPLTLSLILWAVINHKKHWLIFFCAILLTIKEHYGLAVLGTGLLWAWHWHEPKFGIALATVGLISFLIVIKILMPYFNPEGTVLMMMENSEIDRFSWLTHPFRDMDFLIKRITETIFYAIVLLFSLWFQPLFSFVWLLPALADGAINSLATEDMLRHPSAYHSAALIPVLLIAYTKTISERYTNTTNIKNWEMLTVTALMVTAFSYGFVSLPNFPNNFWEFSKPRLSLSSENQLARDEVAKIVGTTAPLSIQNNLMPHIPVRRFMYIFPNSIENSEYIVISTDLLFKKKQHAFGIPYQNSYFSSVDQIMNDKNWGVVFYKNNWLVFKRGEENNPTLHAAAAQDIIQLQKDFAELLKKKQ